MVKNHFIPDLGKEQIKHMQRNKTLVRIILWFTIDFLPSSWMVHVLSSIGLFTEEISIHTLTQECYLIMFHCILSSIRKTVRPVKSFVACFVSSSYQVCGWTVVLFRDQWACTGWHFLFPSLSNNFQQVQIHISSGEKGKRNSSMSDFTSGS